MKIYTCIKGEVITGSLVNETLQGFRVEGGKVSYGHIVFKSKLRTGWITADQKPYFTEKSFSTIYQAAIFANEQLISMETYYLEKLWLIKEAKLKLGQL